MTNQNCVFCKIVNKEESVSIVYEDEKIVGFMNIKPTHPGECLLIPKEHIDHFTDIDKELAAHIMKTAQQLAQKKRKEFNPLRIGYAVAGFGVPHAHLIIVPQHHMNDITSEHYATIKNGKILFTDKHIPIVNRSELDKIAKKLKL